MQNISDAKSTIAYQGGTSQTSELTTTPENLTEMGRNLGLEPSLKRRRNANTPQYWKDFNLDTQRLPGYILALDGKRGLFSWVYNHGVRVQHTRSGRFKFLCGSCYEDGKIYLCNADKSTTSAAAHLETQHKMGKDGPIRSTNQGRSITDLLRQPQAGNLLTRVDPREFRRAYMRWIILDNITFRGATSENFYNMFKTAAPIISRFIPRSHNTIPAWLDLEYSHALAAMLTTLRAAVSVIHVSFDVWTSDSNKAYLGVIAHFLDASCTRRNVLLALPRVRGHHDSARIAGLLLQTLQRYGLTDNDCTRLGYFIADNHIVNDSALERLSQSLPAINVKVRRIRCANHICNLGATAAIYGVDKDAVNDVIQALDNEAEEPYTRRRRSATITSSTLSTEPELRVERLQQTLASKVITEVQKLQAWRRIGPMGKLHNIIAAIRSSSLQSDVFDDIQRAVATHGEAVFKPVSDGGVRWNSTYDMAQVACEKLRLAIDMYCLEASRVARNNAAYNVIEDRLSDEDWDEIMELKDVLKPFKEATKRLEGAGDEGSYGSLWESLLCLETIMTCLEDKKQQLSVQPNTHLKACVNMAWKKVNTYYKRSDETPAYRVAVALHPCLRFAWFKKHWREFTAWQDNAQAVTKELYESYKRRYANSQPLAPPPSPRRFSPARDVSAIDEACLNLVPDEPSVADEYDRFFSEPPERDVGQYLHNPLRWWRERATVYPTMSRMAFDLLSCPPTSCDVERAFSAAGECFDGLRSRLRDEVGEEQMIMASWLRAGLINIQGFGGNDNGSNDVRQDGGVAI